MRKRDFQISCLGVRSFPSPHHSDDDRPRNHDFWQLRNSCHRRLAPIPTICSTTRPPLLSMLFDYASSLHVTLLQPLAISTPQCDLIVRALRARVNDCGNELIENPGSGEALATAAAKQ